MTTLLTRSEVAERLRTCERTVDRWKAAGVLPAVVLGRRLVRFDEAAVEAFIASNRVDAAEAA